MPRGEGRLGGGWRKRRPLQGPECLAVAGIGKQRRVQRPEWPAVAGMRNQRQLRPAERPVASALLQALGVPARAMDGDGAAVRHGQAGDGRRPQPVHAALGTSPFGRLSAAPWTAALRAPAHTAHSPYHDDMDPGDEPDHSGAPHAQTATTPDSARRNAIHGRLAATTAASAGRIALRVRVAAIEAASVGRIALRVRQAATTAASAGRIALRVRQAAIEPASVGRIALRVRQAAIEAASIGRMTLRGRAAPLQAQRPAGRLPLAVGVGCTPCGTDADGEGRAAGPRLLRARGGGQPRDRGTLQLAEASQPAGRLPMAFGLPARAPADPAPPSEPAGEHRTTGLQRSSPLRDPARWIGRRSPLKTVFKMTLDELEPGQAAQVASVGGTGRFRRRLLEMGILPGTPIERTGQAPLGDPLSYRVRGAVVCLRRTEAHQIAVQR